MKKISVNKLAEYLKADSVRRRRIILDQKQPLDFISIRYKDVRKVIVEYLTNKFDKEIIENELERLSLKESKTDFEDSDVKTSIQALESLLQIEFPDDFLHHKIIKPTKKYSLLIKDMIININPDVIIKGKHRGKEFIGGIKLNIVKSHLLDENDRKNVATLIHQVLQEQLSENSNLNFCISVDVFNKRFDYAPKSYIKRRKEIEFACDELSIVWDSI